jgi:hypothetical protein
MAAVSLLHLLHFFWRGTLSVRAFREFAKSESMDWLARTTNSIVVDFSSFQFAIILVISSLGIWTISAQRAKEEPNEEEEGEDFLMFCFCLPIHTICLYF